jgi:hypothetical protein
MLTEHLFSNSEGVFFTVKFTGDMDKSTGYIRRRRIVFD